MTPKKKSPMVSKTNLYQRFVNINHNHPLLMNLLYIILTACILIWFLLLFLDSWTLHGDEATVPSLKGQSIELATHSLENDGFRWEVMDSVYDTTHKPGTVVEQTPSAGAKVKPGRTVYLTIVAFSPKMVNVPDFMNVSRRQGVSMFEGLGINVNVVTVISQYKDLVLGAKINGVPLHPGQRISVNSNVTIEVGGGNMTDDLDLDGDNSGENDDIREDEPNPTDLDIDQL